MRDHPFVSVYSWSFWRASSFLSDKMHRIPSCDNSASGFPWQWQSGIYDEICLWNARLPFLSLRLLRENSEVLQFFYWVANSQSAKSCPGVMRLFMCGLKHPCEATSLSYALILEVLIFPKFTSWVNICFKLLCWSLGTAERGAPLDLHYWLKYSPSLYFAEV